MSKPIASNWLTWPKLQGGEPAFQSPQEAILYAHQVFDRPEVVSSLRNFRTAIYAKLRAERNLKDPNFTHMLALSLRAHYLTVCCLECGFINDEFDFDSKVS